MNNPKLDFLSKKKYYKDRRNLIRRIFLVLFICSLLFSVWGIYLHINKSDIRIEVLNGRLLNEAYVIHDIELHVDKKKFLFLSPRSLSEGLLASFPLLQDVVIRKYIFPEVKLVVLLREKGLWGKLANKTRKIPEGYVTEYGDFVQADYVNVELLPLDLIPVETYDFVSTPELFVLKRILDYFRESLKLPIEKFLITKKKTLEIYAANSIKVNAGIVDEMLLDKVVKLKDIFKLMKSELSLIQYVDLSLEKGAIVKKSTSAKSKGPKT